MYAALLQQLATVLHATTLSRAVNSGVPWLWPACQILHFVGLSLLMGCVGLLDLRIMGMAKGLELGPLQSLIPWGIAGFIINLITGALMFIADPFHFINNIAFGYKLLFIALAGVNVLFFQMTGLQKKLSVVGANQDAPVAAKLVAGTSLFLWIGVMYWGRMLPFIGNAF